VKNYGLIIEPIQPEDFFLGSSQSLAVKYGAEILVPDGDWNNFTPATEHQDTSDGDTWACVSFGTSNAVEMLARVRFQENKNLSDRFLAKTSGTKVGQGNSPAKVADTLRHGWSVDEKEWPFVNTTEEYYADIPANLPTLAIARGAEFEFGYQYIPNNAASIKLALKSSPVCIAVTAWQADAAGVYQRIQGLTENHWTTIVKVLDNGNYQVFDSFYPFDKEVNPEACKSIAMSYYLNRQIVSESLFKKFINAILALFTESKPESVTEAPKQPPAPSISPVEAPIVPPAPPAPSPTVPPAHESKLETFCLAIRTHEGWFPGSRSQKNNNPGNCRYSNVGYLDIYKPVLRDPQNFAVFKDYATGWLYLQNLIREKIKAHPDWTLFEFFAGRLQQNGTRVGGYAPAEDNNDPTAYAAAVGKQVGADYKTFVISNLV
jgi:hypothetical protein